MASILNDRDIALQATAVRLVSNPANYISLAADYTSFDVVNGIATPSTIRVTATLNGQLLGVPVFSTVSGVSSITQQILNGKAVAFLPYSSLTGNLGTIRASLLYLGVTYTADISIGGQTVKPYTPTGFTLDPYGTDLKLTWYKNTDADIAGYEIRTSNTNWGVDNLYTYRGATNSCTIAPGSVSTSTTWYIKAYDITGLYSETATNISYTTNAPPNIADIFYEYADTSLTNATVTLRWDPVIPTFGLKEYQVTYYSNSLAQNITLSVRDNMIILPADWIGDKTFTIKTVDNLSNISSGYSEVITKRLPDPVTNLKVQVIDNNVQLSWAMPVKTSLPISHALIKRSAATGTWDSAVLIGTKSGEFTTIQELVKGTYAYWVAAVDTDNNISTPVSVPATVLQATDFTFNKEFSSTFSGTKTNAIIDMGGLILPVNTSETWEQHYVNNSWATPNAQVSDKYPLYIQPGTSNAVYQEIFDYGNGSNLVLSSSNITVSLSGQDIIGNTPINVTIATSPDGINYSPDISGLSIFATNFRFIKVILTATRGSGDGITNIGSVYKLTGINVRLDTKLRTDSGTIAATAANSDGGGGTYVNFNNEFMDVSSITLTASSTAPRTCVYDFMDEIYTGTYSIVSNVLTATFTSGSNSGTITDHKLYPGQKVRLSSTTGSVLAGIYTVLTRPTATSITVNIVAANSSGNIYMYPNSMRVYVFDGSGARVDQTVSWTVRGS